MLKKIIVIQTVIAFQVVFGFRLKLRKIRSETCFYPAAERNIDVRVDIVFFDIQITKSDIRTRAVQVVLLFIKIAERYTGFYLHSQFPAQIVY